MVDVAAPSPAASDRELKFALPDGRADVARRWLDAICRRDPHFPAAVVSTIYYDTPDLAALGEKINSDYLKHKIRLRWYSDLAGAPSGPAFIEAKSRVGMRRGKVRVQLPDSAEHLAGWDLQDPRLVSFPLLLRDRGILVGDLWQPVVRIRYRRDRFVEPVSRARISLDADIAAAALSRRLGAVADDRALGTAILEVKGAEEELPSALRPLLQLGARKCSFSKFLAVYAHATRRAL
jgi:VTC domain